MTQRLLAIEFYGLDHRPLGVSGEFLFGSFSESQVATFATEAEAEAAIARATNRRDGSSISLIGTARRAS